MLTRSCSRVKYIPNSFIKNFDDVEFNNIENKLLNWHLPMVKLNKIYNTGMFDFISSMSIKIIEQTIPIGNNFDSLQLLHEDEILRYKDKYKYIHFEPINVTYRIHYKVMNIFSPNAKRYDPKSKTTLIETNLLKSDIVVPRTIKWNEIEMPEQWLLEAAAPPIPIENRKAEEILQFEDGDVIVRFDNNKTARLSTFSSRRPSSAAIRTDNSRFYTPVLLFITLSSSNFVAGESEIKNREDLNFEGIINSQQNIPHGVYSKTKNEQDTLSELGFLAKQVMTLTKSEFSYKRINCNKEFM
ncbi:hypothetical protein LguiA_030438 [Lonicera macranthoides]